MMEGRENRASIFLKSTKIQAWVGGLRSDADRGFMLPKGLPLKHYRSADSFLQCCFWNFSPEYTISKENLQFGLENRGYFPKVFLPLTSFRLWTTNMTT